jgi:predicted nuclease of predicted toxin-antitoxin system
VRGILADANIGGHVEHLAKLMQNDPWTDLWRSLHLELAHFEELGLSLESSDSVIWNKCQEEELILITNNRNNRGADSLEATIRQHNAPHSLPVFTIANIDRFRLDRIYAERVVEAAYEYLLSIDNLRGSGRLYLP